MYVLGISETHAATAALIKDGQIIACISEERFTRRKNQSGFPKKAISYCLKFAGITIKEIDLIAFTSSNPIVAPWYYKKHQQTRPKIGFLVNWGSDLLYLLYKTNPAIIYFLEFILRISYKLGSNLIKIYHINRLSKTLNYPKSKITLFDHHLAHGWSANYVFGIDEGKRLVITNDSSGNGLSSRVFVVKKDHWQEVAKSLDRASLAGIYYYITEFLMFNPGEDEYKVMSLAPYANSKEINQIYPVFKKLIWCKGLTFTGSLPWWCYYPYFRQNLQSKNKEVIAGAAQRLVDRVLVKQVKNAVLKYKIKNVVLGGGLAQNIKANMVITKQSWINNLMVCPSPGDESNALGLAFLGYKKLCDQHNLNFNPRRVKDLYLGPDFNTQEIARIVREISKEQGYQVRKIRQHKIAEVVARLLSDGEVIARFSSRMEFGARSLGNRSILADPRKVSVVKIINESIKQRDTWMPFAPTILYEDRKKYLINPKDIDSSFMMVGFETTKHAQKEIPATLHPFDHTCRPQLLRREDNPKYYEIIKEFKKLTGVGAVLNTSFNLHGEPIVCSPVDAIKTFKNSGLKYLLLEDYLIKKAFLKSR